VSHGVCSCGGTWLRALLPPGRCPPKRSAEGAFLAPRVNRLAVSGTARKRSCFEQARSKVRTTHICDVSEEYSSQHET